MKKFVVKVIAGVFILIALLVGANALYVRTNYYKNMNDMGKFYDLPSHFDVVNFGASHSQHAFSWTDYDFNGMNMALGAQTIVYDEALFTNYLNHMDQDTTVIMEIMFKSMYEQEPVTGPYDNNITRYYQILNREHIKQWNWSDELTYGYIPILSNREKALTSLINEYILQITPETREIEPKTISIQEATDEPTQVLTGWEYDDMIKEGKRRAQVFMDLSGNQQKAEQYEALLSVIEKCKVKGIQLIFVTAPTLPCFYENFSECFMDTFYSDINELCNQYNIPYFNYTGDLRLLKDYRWYRDTDHLNEEGSKIFSEIFLQDHKDILKFYK